MQILLSVNGFDRVLFNEALQRFQIEPQRSTNLDAGNLPQPGFYFRLKWPEAFEEKWPKEPQQPPALKYSFNLDEAKKLLAKKAAEEESPTE